MCTFDVVLFLFFSLGNNNMSERAATCMKVKKSLVRKSARLLPLCSLCFKLLVAKAAESARHIRQCALGSVANDVECCLQKDIRLTSSSH